MLRIAVLLGATLTLPACMSEVDATDIKTIPLTDRQTSSIQSVVKNKMRDPQSAQFRNLQHLEIVTTKGQTLRHVCGEVNAKNGFGGYVGFTPFKGRLYDGTAFTVDGIGRHVRCPF
jgi:hypothetical protein